MAKVFNIRNGKRTDIAKDCFTGLYIHKTDIEILRLESLSKQISVSQIIRKELRQHILSCPQSIRGMLEEITATAQQKWFDIQSKKTKNKITFSDFKNQVKKELKFHKLSDSQIMFVVNYLKPKNDGTNNKARE